MVLTSSCTLVVVVDVVVAGGDHDDDDDDDDYDADGPFQKPPKNSMKLKHAIFFGTNKICTWIYNESAPFFWGGSIV